MHVNASLNAIATVLLLVGFVSDQERPRRSAQAHDARGVRRLGRIPGLLPLVPLCRSAACEFTHPGAVRYVYYAILASHVLLAITVPFLAIRQIYLGFRALGCCCGEVHAGRATRDGRRVPRKAHPAGPLDISDLAVCLGHGRHRVRDALSPLAAGRAMS